MCISFAPASRRSFTILPLVVPLTIESSTKTTRFPDTVSSTALSFILTWSTLVSCPGEMKVLPIYLFFIRPMPYGIPDFSEKPNAASNPESGTPITTSASTG